MQLYFEAPPLLAVNQPEQAVVWERPETGGLVALKTGTQAQPVLGSKGDDHRIDWGFLYLGAPSGKQVTSRIASGPEVRGQFADSGALSGADDEQQPRPASQDEPVLAVAFDLRQLSGPVERHVLLAYDEEWAVTFFGRRLRPS